MTQRARWVALVNALRAMKAGPEDFERTLAEINKEARERGAHHDDAWRRENLRKAFREAGVEV